MAGRKAYDRESYLEEIEELLRAGVPRDQIARRVGISRRTLYRLLAEQRSDA